MNDANKNALETIINRLLEIGAAKLSESERAVSLM
jgi:hypothetical protein